MDHSDAVSQFAAITGADLPTAEHFLAAANWDLNASTNFYFESGSPSLAQQDFQPAPPEAAATQPEIFRDPVADQPATRGPSPLPPADSDDALQAALAASLQPIGRFESFLQDLLYSRLPCCRLMHPEGT